MSGRVRLLWLFCLATAARKRRTGELPTVVNDGDDIAALLLDRRLAMARGCHITSFIAGMVASCLPPLMLFLDSVVLSTVPLPTLELFTSLLSEALPAVRRCRLLFCSSRDGTTAAAFHRHCDRKGPTLTLIKDTDGNVFGGYAGVEWGGGANWTCLNDPAAFLFTVLNPHADPPALFPSKTNKGSIYRHSSYGPVFGWDLRVSGAFDGGCYSHIGRNYVNATRHSYDTVLTGAVCFTPAEVEVWGME